MENDEISRYLASLEREDCYRVDATLKESPHEVTQRVFFVGANGSESGPYVRKFIRRESGMGAAYERIFEAQSAGRRFRHVPDIIECYRRDDFLVVIMEFVRGETLQDVVYRRDPSVQVAIEIFPALCDAVSEIHESFDAPIIHRDLKPSNVIITGGGLVLIDFGISRTFREGAESDTTKFGTRPFAPPEQFGFGQTTVRSDVYALGMMLYYCLTEEIPTQQVHDMKFAVGNVPERLRPVLVRATAFDPDARFASAAELKGAFLEVVSQSPDAPESPVAPPRSTAATAYAAPDARTRTRARTHRSARIIAIALALFFLASLSSAFIEAWTTNRHPSATATDASEQEEASAAHETAAESGDADAESSSEAKTIETVESATDDAFSTAAPPRNGFDSETNFTTTVAGVTFQIPRYFGAPIKRDENSADNATYYYAESGSSLSMIMTSESAAAGSEEEDADYNLALFLIGVKGSSEALSEIVSLTNFELAGHPARIAVFRGVVEGLTVTSKMVYFYNASTHVLGSIDLGQTDNAQFDYSTDFAKTIASAVPAR